MPCTHDWYCVTDLMLTVPDVHGYHDRLVTWACHQCPAEVVTTGYHHLRSPLLTPTQWEQVQAQERKHGTPLARLAARENQHRIAGLRG